MIDANTLLNPDFSDAELRAYAYLSTQFRRGVRSPVDCLQPFVVQGIASFVGGQLDWRKVREFLKEKFRLTVPFYMLERMQGSLIQAGALQKSELSRALVCGDARPNLAGESVDLAVTDIDQLGHAISEYAKRRGVYKPLTADQWSDLIIPFFSKRKSPKDKISAKFRGILLSEPKSFDHTIIADFVMAEFVGKTRNYKIIEQIYHGLLVSDFLTQMETAGNKASFKGLAIFYDAPVIMRLLGCSGKILQEATLDLHDTLRELGCRTYYFRHTYDEVFATVEAILTSHERGQPIFRETQEAIARRETSISEIYKIRAELDLRLSASLGLVEHAAGYESRKSDDFQIDEHAFRDYLIKGGWGRFGQQAANRDVASLALIARLRGNKQVRDVSKSGFVFVTHNTKLAVMAKDFLKEEGHLADGSVWPFMTVGQTSTIAWVVNETFDNDRHVSKELIANCYAATLPDDDFDKTLKETLSQTDPQLTHELYKNAFVVQSIRQVALSQTAGHSALIRTLSTAEILAEAETARDEAVASAREAERKNVLAEVAAEADQRRTAKAEKMADRVAQAVLLAACVISVVAAGRDYGFFGGSKNEAPWVSVVLLIVAVYGALDIFAVLPAASIRAGLRRVIKRPVAALQNVLS